MNMNYQSGAASLFVSMAREDNKCFRWCPKCGVTDWKKPLGNKEYECKCGHIIKDEKVGVK